MANPGSLAFGSVAVGSQAALPDAVTNTGTGSCEVIATLSPTTDPYFSLGSSAPTSALLAPGQTLQLSVDFSPTSASAPATRDGAIVVLIAGSSGPGLSVPLTASIGASSCLAGGTNCTGNGFSCCAGLSCVQSVTEKEFACCGGSNPWPACQGLSSSGGSSSGGLNSCEQAGGQCVATVAGSCSNGTVGNPAIYPCDEDGGLTVECCLQAGVCPTGEIVCDGQCTNPLTDAANCGGCAGDGGRVCPLCDSWGCGICCQGICGLHQGDPNNCGGCGIVCPTGEICSLDPFETCELPDAGAEDGGGLCPGGGVQGGEWPTWAPPPDAPPVSQYTVDAASGTITDSATGLTWIEVEPSLMTTWQAALVSCSCLSAGGETDWRLPNAVELLSIVDYATSSPAIEGSVFVGAGSSWTWSSTSYVYGGGSDNGPYTVEFGGGVMTLYGEGGWMPSYTGPARCVRGPVESATAPVYVVSNGTVYDPVSKLTWQQVLSGTQVTASGAASYCSGLTLGHGIWLLPEVKQLESLVDRTSVAGSLSSSTVFQGFGSGQSALFWSATPDESTGGLNQWAVDLNEGSVVQSAVMASNLNSVICVLSQ